MQCDCITEVSKNLAKNMTTQIGAAAQAECQNQALCIVGNSLESHVAIHFKITSSAKGYVKGKTMNVIASFCPFCGKPTKPEIKAEDATAPATPA